MRPVPLLFLAAGLLGACTSASRESAAESPQAPPAAARPPRRPPVAPPPDSAARATAATSDSVSAPAGPGRLVRLPVGPDIGPHPLECPGFNQSELPRAKDGQLRGTFYWGGRLLLTRLDDYEDALLLRDTPRDTTWLHLPVDVPAGFECSAPEEAQVQLVNLDRQGPPEVLFYFKNDAHGAGGGTTLRVLNVFSLAGEQPQLLLRTLQWQEVESWSGGTEKNGNAEPTLHQARTERRVRLRGRDIELGAFASEYGAGIGVDRKTLPGPLPGRYRYQGGRLYRVEASR
ncbi:hypothetical protein EJV47_13275 [Hymenobacter gummosus]|uniref:Uncharacterized protein n=1 Tax=Hymenobacter gummosus TaxID=1776032 RepID=A0A431U384_9BACT|nr:hypothetical protein [Hymenobacter gummosus]RTQ49774.1 hypothetical protein EJV47_13275 [Hymenobacter gummosus]